jgi:hypothetical protein
MQKENKHMKRCSVPFLIRKMQMKTPISCCHTSIMTAKIKNNDNASKDEEKLDLSNIVGRNAK